MCDSKKVFLNDMEKMTAYIFFQFVIKRCDFQEKDPYESKFTQIY